MEPLELSKWEQIWQLILQHKETLYIAILVIWQIVQILTNNG